MMLVEQVFGAVVQKAVDLLAAETEHVGAIAANMLDAAVVDVRPLRL